MELVHSNLFHFQLLITGFMFGSLASTLYFYYKNILNFIAQDKITLYKTEIEEVKALNKDLIASLSIQFKSRLEQGSK